MGNRELKFIHFSLPVATPPDVSNTANDDTGLLLGKRKRGRPLGTKNKKKDGEKAVSDSENNGGPSSGSPDDSDTGTVPKKRKKSRKNKNKSSDVSWKPGDSMKVPGNAINQTAQQITKNAHPQPADTLNPESMHPTPHPITPVNVQSPLHRARHLVDEESMSSFENRVDISTLCEEGENNMNVINDIEDVNLLDTLIAEGLGEEPDGDPEENGLGVVGEDPPHADSKRHKHQPQFPSWLSQAFEKAVAELTADRKSLAGSSRHYTAGNFWLPCKDPWFVLRKQDLMPTDLFIPQFYVWDPLDALHGSGISCPNCSRTLTRDGIVNRPRRVVDIDQCFFLIGYNYACRKASGGCESKFRSWHPRILQNLPRPLAAEFPAHLTWRSGISLRAFGIVRSSFQNGMGPNQVADMFRVQHLRHYDELRLRYLHTKISRIQVGGQTYEPFRPFDDRSDSGFHGYTPSGQWLRDVYDNIMESHQETLNQHTAMLSARICAIDHSHKIAKQVFKVDGVPIFTALLTMTNEKGEIKGCFFVPSKSQSQYVDALQKISEELTLYGHPQPQAFYTDNISDKGMLERVFPSLLDDVVAVEKYSHLPEFSLPDTLHPSILSSTSHINNVVRGILDDIPLTGQITIGFDSEWNVDTSGGRIIGHGPPEIVQIAYKDQVYILRVGTVLAEQGSLPHELLNLLQDGRVVKAGRQVTGDLRRLAIASHQEPSSFQGGLDLAAYAKQQLLIDDAQLSLADLTASILGQCLPKNRIQQITFDWSSSELTPNQIQYAARDAWVSLSLWHKISQAPAPSLLTETSAKSIGLPVIILTEDHKKTAAKGVVSQAASHHSVDGINITPTRTVITVNEVLVPGTVMSQHQKRSLQEMGIPPFDVVTHRTHVRVIGLPPNTPSLPSTMFTSSRPTSPRASTSSELESETPMLPPPCDEEDPEMSDMIDVPLGDMISNIGNSDETVGQIIGDRDIESAELGSETLGPNQPASFTTIIRTRVIKDAFHVFNMIYISRSHGLRVPFAQALRDALLVPHPEDKRQIEAYLGTKNLKWDDMMRYNPSWLWRHCRRTIPPPEIIYPLVHDVFMTWGPLKDAKTHKPLFDGKAWKKAKEILELIRCGFVSDPPGVSLFYILGLDKHANGLPIYRCVRGTNFVEGGVHTHLRNMLPSRNTSVRHMIICLLDFILRHNLLVGTYNSTGKKYCGHDYIWLLNEIQELEIALSTVYATPPTQLSWVNGNLYQKTKQAMGIMPITESVRVRSGMRDFVESTDRKQKQVYLAKMQGTCRPILPVHTAAEKKYFNKAMRDLVEFQTSTTKIKPSAVKIWNQQAEREDDIYYKLEEHLTTYLNGKWQDNANSKESICQAIAVTEPLTKRLQNPARTREIINTSAMKPSTLQVTQGFDENPTQQQRSPVPEAGPSAVHDFADANHLATPVAQTAINLSVARATKAAPEPAVKPRKRERECPRCGQSICNGRQAWFRCQYACQDCNTVSVVQCVGRKSEARTKRRCTSASSIMADLTPAAREFINDISSTRRLDHLTT
ncbi:hypothetical protein H0H93_003273 [Arthromyces matolae]|nr:hypothetical protein H0H93_003273 [Arthromyces matolae]